MSPHFPAPASVRPAAAVNDAIRALVRGADGREWRQAERALYGLLRDEWVEAVREEMTAAA